MYPISVFTDLQLGETFALNCVQRNITELSISWWKNNTLFMDGNRLEIPSLQLSDNNTIYTCIVSVKKNPSGCFQNQSREYLIRLKS